MRAAVVVATVVLASCMVDRTQAKYEAVAIGTMRTLYLALEQYRAQCDGYPVKLQQLGAPPSGAASDCAHAGLVRADALAFPILTLPGTPLGGFVFRYSARPSSGEGVRAASKTFELSADRHAVGCQQCRSFWMDGSGIMRGARKAVAGPTDEVILRFRGKK
jgi:hypothetical protein